MPTFDQTRRPVRLATPLGENVLLVKSLTGGERLGRLFQYELVLYSETHDLDYKKITGQNVTVQVEKQAGDNEDRYFNGFISRFALTGYEGRLTEYRATLVPWLWFLTRSSDCRIFQNQTIPEILQQVFKDHGFSDVIDRLSGAYRKWDYCVQYRETAFAFVNRLMEEEGIYYYFKHEADKHSLVLCDSPASHKQFAGYEDLLYRPSSKTTRETLWNWAASREVQSGAYATKFFDFSAPRKTTLALESKDREHAGSQFEQFDYLGEQSPFDEGERYTKLRLEEQQAQHETYSGEGDLRGICTGVRFKLKGHPRTDFNVEYLTTGVDYTISANPLESMPGKGEDFEFEARLSAMPQTEPFRPPRVTPKPLVHGPQTAVVVGPQGEEIYTDNYGRVKVQFHWDRQGKADENSSSWIRVSSQWAGRKWGELHLPRIGQEVLVEFLEGDPDRPIITGRVYNDSSMPPYDLPANKTISTLKSNSSKGGKGFNEIRFEDKKDSEQIFIHGEKNVDIRVKNDVYELVQHDRHLIVKNDQVEQVENDRQEKIKRDHVEEIDRDHHLTVKGKEAIKITGSHSFTVEDDVIEVFKKNQSTQITKNLYIKAENIVLEATKNITINVGDSYIAIESGGIKLATNGDIILDAKGSLKQTAATDVSIEASANAALKGTAGLKLQSPAPAELSSSAILTLKGSLVQIN